MSLSLPVEQTNALELFQTFDRASYKANYGKPAPVVDLTKMIKTWEDDSLAGQDPNKLVTYMYYKTDMSDPDVKTAGAPVPASFQMTVAEAMAVNLMGKEDIKYLPYVPAPTDAFIQSPFGVKGSVSPFYLSTQAQADALAKLIPGATVGQPANTPGGFNMVYPSDENRRRFEITTPAGLYNVGQLVQMQNAINGNGLGGVDADGNPAPGHWSASSLAAGRYVWVNDQVPDGNDGKSHPAWPVPQRKLRANEAFIPISTVLGTVWTIGPIAQAPVIPSASGGLTAAQAQQLAETHDAVMMLLNK